ncbi:unnamed protein product [Urochloa humidicola]
MHGSDTGAYDAKGTCCTFFNCTIFPEVNFRLTVPTPRTRAWVSFPISKEVAPPTWFVPEKFEEIFMKHAKVIPDALTSVEIEEMILANRDPLDPQSWSAPEGEWGLIYKLASDKYGFLHKDSVRGLYDGKVFYKLEEQRKSSRSDM